VAARHFFGLTGAFWGILSERKGYTWGMLMGLVTLLLGALTVSVSQGFLLALLGFVLIGISKPVYDPSVQAFVSSRIPYSKRARALGLLESSWAGSWLIGIPLCGLLIARFGWRSPFMMISGAALLAMLWTKRVNESGLANSNFNPEMDASVGNPEKTATSSVRPIMVLGVSLLMIFANENIVIVYGAWLEEQFHLQVQALGFFSILVGVAELAGELTVVFLVDRIGKRRAILGGLILTTLSYLALPFCQGSLFLALLGLVAMFYLFEFTIVSIFPYVSELVPAERGKWLAFNYTALVVGRLGGALTGPWLWQRSQDLHILAVLSVLAQISALLLLVRAGTGSKQAAGS
jgi:predicted MFS family arabinose efflux permease